MPHLLITIVALLASIAPGLTQARLPATDDAVLADRRLAAGYIRTGNAALAALALERLVKALAGAPQAAQAARALDAVDAGDLATAGDAVEALAADLAAQRRAAGVRLPADCVRDFSEVYALLDRHRTRPPDLADSTARAAVADAATSSDAALARCDAEAPALVRADPDFRRLVDGARASLARVPDAARSGDGELLHRFMIELRAYEQLLRFRFG
ncbi:hypothetical protein CH341_15520 [Rhodoplanes roseus]|uniref:NarX-like N-terminal domain-containing protein n=2 Tax=Rhodoplanes roseus TaxID=29409 RepID=A0A327L118_9BRAD|nr:hypothetical protein CH341_15520 [Rhodoplanes roseus]